MPAYRKPIKDVKWSATKWDTFVIEATGKPYRHQKGSGRHIIFDLIKVGMKVGEWTKAAAKLGYDPSYVVGSLLKHQGAEETAAFRMSEKNAEGQSLKEISKVRQRDPEKAKAIEEQAKAKAEAKVKREADREAKAKAKAEAKVKKDAERKAKAEAKAKQVAA